MTLALRKQKTQPQEGLLRAQLGKRYLLQQEEAVNLALLLQVELEDPTVSEISNG